MKKTFKHVEIILKVSERCNINCTYCYVYNLGNEIAINSKAMINQETVLSIRRFFEQATREYNIGSIQIDLHGGEPLMLGKKKLPLLCETILAGDYNNTPLSFALQTNATLIDDEWIDIFSQYNIHVGISVDGPKHINDKHRIDKKGRGTYDSTIKGFKMLQDAWKDGRLRDDPGILCVSNNATSGAVVYRHFVDELKAKKFDFLIPDDNHESGVDPMGIAEFYATALDEYFKDADKSLYIRHFYIHLQSMLSKSFSPVMGISKGFGDTLAFTVSSNGDIYVDDTLRSTNDEIFTPMGNTKNSSLTDCLNSWQQQKYFDIENSIPESCTPCVWKKICGGGRHINRYSKVDDYSRPSVYCPSLKFIFSRMASYLIESGVDETLIMENLEINT